jgi:molybdopterin-biosynthesis enzyme MoeA-like protein
MTLKGISLSLGRPLTVNPGALAMVKQRYAKIEGKPRLTPYRKKMATLPRGAVPLPNPVGTAPGVLIHTSHTTIFSLPGVPSEMKAIFNRLIVPFLESAGGKSPSEMQLYIIGTIESTIAPILDKARRKFPGLYFKSHPKGRETGGRPVILLHIYNIGSGPENKIVQAVDYVMNKLSDI